MSQPLAGRDDRPFRGPQMAAEHAALIQSRETGDILPNEAKELRQAVGQVKALPFAKSWVHLLAGA